MLTHLTEKAQLVGSEPYVIEHQIQLIVEGVKLLASFIFCCEAETLIFQLNLHSLNLTIPTEVFVGIESLSCSQYFDLYDK